MKISLCLKFTWKERVVWIYNDVHLMLKWPGVTILTFTLWVTFYLLMLWGSTFYSRNSPCLFNCSLKLKVSQELFQVCYPAIEVLMFTIITLLEFFFLSRERILTGLWMDCADPFVLNTGAPISGVSKYQSYPDRIFQTFSKIS